MEFKTVMRYQQTFCFTLIILFNTSFSLASQKAFLPQQDWPEHTLQFQKKFQQDKYYSGVNGTKNYYSYFNKPSNSIKAPLIIITGVEDFPLFWLPTAEKAIAYGFKHVFVVELRGQGFSQRVPGNNIRAIHVNSFKNYSLDLLTFFKILSQDFKFSEAPYVLSHSTGSTVMTNSLEELRLQFPQLFPQKMSFWTPLIKLPVSPFLDNFIMRNLLSAVHSIAFAFKILITIKNYSPETFKENHLTTSQTKFKIMQNYKFNHTVGSSGISLKWVLEALKGTKKLRTMTFKNISMPTLIFTAEKDQVVDNNWTLDNKNISHEIIPHAKHALNLERDEIFNPITNKTLNFFNKSSQQY